MYRQIERDWSRGKNPHKVHHCSLPTSKANHTGNTNNTNVLQKSFRTSIFQLKITKPGDLKKKKREKREGEKKRSPKLDVPNSSDPSKMPAISNSRQGLFSSFFIIIIVFKRKIIYFMFFFLSEI